jgi:hypothetical protein
MSTQTEPLSQEQIERYTRIFLRTTPVDAEAFEKVKQLARRKNRIQIMLGLNIVAIFLFGFSYFKGLSEMSDLMILALGGVFLLNVGLMTSQLKQITRFKIHLEDSL